MLLVSVSILVTDSESEEYSEDPKTLTPDFSAFSGVNCSSISSIFLIVSFLSRGGGCKGVSSRDVSLGLTRFTEFSDSTLGVIESSLCNGPVHFDCYPDFTLQQLPTPDQSQRHVPAKHSFAASSSTLERDLELEKAMIDFKPESLRKTSQVTQPCYGQVPEDKSDSPESPTQSDFLVENLAAVDNQLRPLNKKFEIDRKRLNRHLKAPKNQSRRDNYHQAYPDSKHREQIFSEWKDYMRSVGAFCSSSLTNGLGLP
ncbi:hypothetical protein L3X38_009935 [Prunus dulcis]|uniref:Uncharacterized protein n=1 Tax=Prunus dulcis TaxID=3755 RepID=A0AAD4WEK0_PRUDU|nr:hypothetical protein L3X38_009935 [Prunus dulcis]